MPMATITEFKSFVITTFPACESSALGARVLVGSSDHTVTRPPFFLWFYFTATRFCFLLALVPSVAHDVPSHQASHLMAAAKQKWSLSNTDLTEFMCCGTLTVRTCVLWERKAAATGALIIRWAELLSTRLDAWSSATRSTIEWRFCGDVSQAGLTGLQLDGIKASKKTDLPCSDRTAVQVTPPVYVNRNANATRALRRFCRISAASP